MCVYIYTHIYVCVYIYTYICLCVYIYVCVYIYIYTWASLVAQLIKNLPAMQETWV